MSILDQMSDCKEVRPFFGAIYGVSGVGKTSLGAEMPSPVFIDLEGGTSELRSGKRLPKPNSYTQVLEQIKGLTTDSHDRKSLIIDSLDHIEPLVWDHVCYSQDKKVTSLESIPYGKGYLFALDEWRKMISALAALREKRGMNILLVAHSIDRPAKDPTAMEDYNRFQMKLHEKAAALWTEVVDCLFFANYETHVMRDKKDKVKAFSDGSRFLFTERRAGFLAKNRFSLPFQVEMIKGETWKTLSELMGQSKSQTSETLTDEIKSLLDGVTDEGIKSRTMTKLESAQGDVAVLEGLKARLQTYLNVA